MSNRTAGILSFCTGLLLVTGFLIGSTSARAQLLLLCSAAWQFVRVTPWLALLIVVLALVAIAVLALRFILSSRRRRVHHLRVTTTRSIAEAPDGLLTKIVGHLRVDGQPLVAPFTQTACAVYLVEILDGSTSPPRRVRRIQKAATDFWIDDGTGKIRVQTGELVSLFTKTHVMTAPLPACHMREALQLIYSGDAPVPWWTAHLSVRECILEVDQEVAIIGVIRTEPAVNSHSTEGTYRTPPMTKQIIPPAWSRVIVCDMVSPEAKDVVLEL